MANALKFGPPSLVGKSGKEKHQLARTAFSFSRPVAPEGWRGQPLANSRTAPESRAVTPTEPPLPMNSPPAQPFLHPQHQGALDPLPPSSLPHAAMEAHSRPSSVPLCQPDQKGSKSSRPHPCHTFLQDTSPQALTTIKGQQRRLLLQLAVLGDSSLSRRQLVEDRRHLTSPAPVNCGLFPAAVGFSLHGSENPLYSSGGPPTQTRENLLLTAFFLSRPVALERRRG